MSFDTSPPRILTKDEIWAVDDIVEREVEIPQWRDADGNPGKVRVRSLTLEQLAEVQVQSTKAAKGRADLLDRLQVAGLLCEGIIEPELDFNEAQRLMKKSAAAVSVIVGVIKEITGLLPGAIAEAEKSTEERSVPALSILAGARAEDDETPVASGDVGG